MSDHEVVTVTALATCILIGTAGDAMKALQMLGEMEPTPARDLAIRGVRKGVDRLAETMTREIRDGD